MLITTLYVIQQIFRVKITYFVETITTNLLISAGNGKSPVTYR
jgi:hypothetical protein